jgi:hypothetical protein
MMSEDGERIFEAQIKSYELEEAFEWHKWRKEIPYIQFPSHWHVKIMPPFAAAIIRFGVSLTGEGGCVSVYLDCYGTLGGVAGKPYWEIYPAADGDTERFQMNDIKGLLEAIEKSLRKQNEV